MGAAEAAVVVGAGVIAGVSGMVEEEAVGATGVDEGSGEKGPSSSLSTSLVTFGVAATADEAVEAFLAAASGCCCCRRRR
jgi:hypothetical protein